MEAVYFNIYLLPLEVGWETISRSCGITQNPLTSVWHLNEISWIVCQAHNTTFCPFVSAQCPVLLSF